MFEIIYQYTILFLSFLGKLFQNIYDFPQDKKKNAKGIYSILWIEKIV